MGFSPTAVRGEEGGLLLDDLVEFGAGSNWGRKHQQKKCKQFLCNQCPQGGWQLLRPQVSRWALCSVQAWLERAASLLAEGCNLLYVVQLHCDLLPDEVADIVLILLFLLSSLQSYPSWLTFVSVLPWAALLLLLLQTWGNSLCPGGMAGRSGSPCLKEARAANHQCDLSPWNRSGVLFECPQRAQCRPIAFTFQSLSGMQMYKNSQIVWKHLLEKYIHNKNM